MKYLITLLLFLFNSYYCLAQSFVLKGNVAVVGSGKLVTEDNVQYLLTNAFMWLRSDSGVYIDSTSTLATNGNRVNRWEDISGHGNHVTNYASALHTPYYFTNQLDGYPGIFFTGSNILSSFLERSALTGVGTNGRTFIVVSRLMNVGNTAYPTMICQGSGSAASELRFFTTSFTIAEANIGGGTAASYNNASLSTNTYYFHALTKDNNENVLRYWQDKVIRASQANTAAISGNFYTIGNRQDTGQTWKGYIVEVILWDTKLTDVEVGRIYDYIKTRYPSVN